MIMAHAPHPVSELDLALFDEAPVAFHEIDRDGVIVRVNQTECTLLGFSREEMIGHHI